MLTIDKTENAILIKDIFNRFRMKISLNNS